MEQSTEKIKDKFIDDIFEIWNGYGFILNVIYV